jgi:proteasome lid subunit RPN8/RPN11
MDRQRVILWHAVREGTDNCSGLLVGFKEAAREQYVVVSPDDEAAASSDEFS